MSQELSVEPPLAVPAGEPVGGAGDPFADLEDLPLEEHVARFEAVHDALRARLAGEPGGPVARIAAASRPAGGGPT